MDDSNSSTKKEVNSNDVNKEEEEQDSENDDENDDDDDDGVAMKVEQNKEQLDEKESGNKPPNNAQRPGRPRRKRKADAVVTRKKKSIVQPKQEQQQQQPDDDDDDDVDKAAAEKEQEEEEEESLSKESSHVCPHCQKNFSSIHGLNYHVNKLVCQPKPCPAVGCERTFPTLLALRYHLNSGDCTGVLPANGNEESESADENDQHHDDNDNAIPLAGVAPPGRRSSPRRNRTRINYSLDTDEEDEEEVDLDDDDEAVEDSEIAGENESDDDAGDDDDDEDSAFSESSQRPKKKSKRSTISTSSKKHQQKKTTASNKKCKNSTPAAAAEEEEEPVEFACQYCNRKFQGKAGLRYHIDFFVCRPNDRPGGPVRKGKRKVVGTASTAADDDADAANTGSSSSHSKYKRIRGSLDDRTCGNCSRVFTSVLGLQYHIEKRVCQQVKQDAALAFPTLQPGMKFDTPYGVVQVVRDNAAIPTARLRSDLRNSARHYTNAKIKHEIKIARNIQSVAVTHLARRKRLRHLYERSIMAGGDQADLMNQTNVFACYFGKDPRLIPRKERVAQPTAGPLKHVDPCAPEGSFPDRIVECILVEDKRDRYSSLEEHAMRASKKRPSQDNDQSVATAASSSAAAKPAKLFLRRRMLTEPYSETTDLLTCRDCGAVFTSRSGCTYHVNSKVCFQKIDTGKEETRERIELMDKRAIAYLLQREKRVVKGLEERSMPIDFILSLTSDNGMVADSTLGVEMVAGPLVGSTAPAISKKKPHPTDPVQKLDKTIVGDPNFKDPRLILAELKAELRYQQSIMCGPMYPSVFKALGYKKPRKPTIKKRRRPKPKPPAASQPPPTRPTRRQPVAALPAKSPPPQPKEPVASLPQRKQAVENTNKIQPPQSATNGRFAKVVTAARPPRRVRDRKALPIYDIRPLCAEVRAGRYPTVKARGSGDADDPPHSPACVICNKVVRDKRKNPQKDVLLPCDFCDKQVHMSCMLTKVVIKEPEPGEDFMCYQCIGCLCARRARAERRRLEKLTKESSSTPVVPVLDVTSTIVITQHRFASDPCIVPVKELVSFTNQVVEGREYDCVVAQGRRLHDLVELTRDSQNRLAQHTETSRMNAARQQMLDL